MDSQCCSFLRTIVVILDEMPLSYRKPRMTEGRMSNKGYVVDNEQTVGRVWDTHRTCLSF